jgi:hypothetical protein
MCTGAMVQKEALGGQHVDLWFRRASPVSAPVVWCVFLLLVWAQERAVGERRVARRMLQQSQ